MKKNRLFLLLFIVPLLSFSSHKFYVSLTQIHYKNKEKSVQIIINVFMDDIEKALNEDYHINLQLESKRELKNNDSYFKKYLNDKLKFKINGISKKYNYIGKEYDGKLVYIYLEIKNIDSVKEIEVSNKILISHFPRQQNLIKSKVGKIHKSLLLTKEDSKGILKY